MKARGNGHRDRQPGFYWVQYAPDCGEWTVAELDEQGWWLIGASDRCEERELKTIGTRIDPPERKS